MNTTLLHEVLNKPLIGELLSLAKARKRKIYLVGGFLRDIVIGRVKEALDLDFAVDRDAISFAHAFAKQTKSGFVVLDREHGCARVLSNGWTLDFSDFRGKDLKQDLLRRDFTVNTLALELPLKRKELKAALIDYYGAVRDLKAKVIRMASAKSFDEDHLRILRAFSMSAQLGFRIEAKTITQAKKKRELLRDVAGERIRDEFFKILDAKESIGYIKQMDKLGILSQVIPQIELMRRVKQGGYHHLDVLEHSFEALKQLDLFFASNKDKALNDYSDEILAGTRKRRQLIKLVCLLHDIGKPQAKAFKEGRTLFHGHERIGRDISKAVSEKLKLSTRERWAIETMIFWHLRPGYLGDNKNITPRAKFRYFRDTGDEALSVLLLSIADQRATRGPLAVPASRIQHEKVAFKLIDEYFHAQKKEPMVRLIDGNDLIKELKLAPSPLFKIILQEIEERQAEGSITTKQDALEAARHIVQKNSAAVKPKGKKKR